jgi:hypothetical protein
MSRLNKILFAGITYQYRPFLLYERYEDPLGHAPAWSRKVADSILQVMGFLNCQNPSSRIMALGSTQPPTEMSTRNLPGVKGGRRLRLTPYRHLWADCLENVGVSTSHNPMSLHDLLQGKLYPFMRISWWQKGICINANGYWLNAIKA